MGNFVIRKKVSLDFLGDEYKDCYIVYKAIALKEFDKIIGQAKDAGDDGIQATKYMQTLLEDKFIEGKFKNEKGELVDLTKEDIADFDIETVTKSFTALTGQVDPKVE